MGLTYSQVEQVLAEAYEIVEPKRSAFSNRLKHLQKLKFLPGINTGRGRAATYRVEHMLSFALAIELGKLGNSPERSAQMITRNDEAIRAAAAKALNSLDVIVITYYPDAWSEITGSTRDGYFFSPDWFDVWAVNDLTGGDGSDLRNLLGVTMHGLAIINVTGLVNALMSSLNKIAPETSLRCDLLSWAGAAEEED